MELLFNALWVFLTLALGTLWLRGLRRRAEKNSFLPGPGVQLVALVMLAIVLLPAISLTDDLQACITPVEFEHLVRRDSHWTGDHAPQDLTLAVVLLSPWLQPAPSRLAGFLAEDTPAPRHIALDLRSLDNRPPPVA